MDGLTGLWQKRRNDFWGIASRYLRLLANGAFGFYILLLLIGFYYQQAVQDVPDAFPVVWLATILLTFIVSRRSIRTFVRRADLVFLLPAEQRLEAYFQKAERYSFLMQSVVLIFLWAALNPLWSATVGTPSEHYVVMGGLIVLLKGWNIACGWYEYYTENSRRHESIRIAFTAVALYLILDGASWLFLLMMTVLGLSLLRWFYATEADEGYLNWERLVEEENTRMQRFYKFANLIADVPELETKVTPRKALSRLANRYPLARDSYYKKLFLLTFIRTGDYLGLYVRLSVLGCLAIPWIPNGYGVYVAGLLFMYLTAVQLLLLGRHPFPQALEGLHPIKDGEKVVGFAHVYQVLLMVQAVVFIVTALFTGMFGLEIVIAVLLFFGFAIGYSRFAVKKMKV